MPVTEKHLQGPPSQAMLDIQARSAELAKKARSEQVIRASTPNRDVQTSINATSEAVAESEMVKAFGTTG